MLLIIEALLLILAALGQDHRAAAVKIFPLNMALNSVDDQYEGCSENMTHLVKTTYLKKEMSDSAEFNKTWQESEEKAKKAEDNLQQELQDSLLAYFLSSHSSFGVGSVTG